MNSFFAHKGTKFIVLGWSAFIAENLVLSENRAKIIDAISQKNYHRAYNTLSTAACVSILYGFFRYGKSGPVTGLFKSPAARVAGFAVQALGFAGLAQQAPRLQFPFGYESSFPCELDGEDKDTAASAKEGDAEHQAKRELKMLCPIDFKAQDSPEGGVRRITRHPALFSLGSAMLGSAFCTPYVPQQLFFVFPLVFAVIGGAHQDRRFAAMGKLREDHASTSLVPFVALLDGRQKWADLPGEIKWMNAGLGVGAAVALAVRREMAFKSLLKKVA